jgi:hypothetical protein
VLSLGAFKLVEILQANFAMPIGVTKSLFVPL